MGNEAEEREWKTRKTRIDPRLDQLGWRRSTAANVGPDGHRTEKEETDNGPADYGLWVDSHLMADKQIGAVNISRIKPMDARDEQALEHTVGELARLDQRVGSRVRLEVAADVADRRLLQVDL